MATPITPPALNDLDPTLVSASLDAATALIQEDNPTLDLRPGPLFSILAYYHALLATQAQALQDNYLAARSLQDLEANPELAPPEYVDAVLSNFRVTRMSGAAAQGPVVIVVSRNTAITIGVGAVFTANGLRYLADATYSAKPSAGQIIAATDRLLTPTNDGNYAFTISVTAEAVGSAYALHKDVTLFPDVLPTNFVNSYAASDFTGAADGETNAEVLERLQEGVSARCLSNRTSMQSMLRAQEPFARVGVSSIVGYGDPELTRADRSIFPIRLGSRCDWYIRTTPEVLRLGLTQAAVLVDVDQATGYGTWQLAVARDDLPGFYEIRAIRPAGTDPALFAGGLEVTADIRGLDLDPGLVGFVPDVQTYAEGAYSRFQTAIIRFVDTTRQALDLDLGVQYDYDFELRGLPLLGEIQDFVSRRDVRHHGADCLVRAPVPCFVQLALTIYKASNQDPPDTAAIAEALASAVSAVGFVGALYAGTLQGAVSPLLTAGMTTSAIFMLGRIRRPDGVTAWLRSEEVLQVPQDPDHMLSPRTCLFCCDPEDVTVSVISSVPVD